MSMLASFEIGCVVGAVLFLACLTSGLIQRWTKGIAKHFARVLRVSSRIG